MTNLPLLLAIAAVFASIFALTIGFAVTCSAPATIKRPRRTRRVA